MTQINLRINEAPWNVKLRVLRALSGESMGKTAENLGVDARTYGIWENDGKILPRKNNRKLISLVYGVTEDEIFGAVAQNEEG